MSRPNAMACRPYFSSLSLVAHSLVFFSRLRSRPSPSLPWPAQRSNKMSGDKRNILDNVRRQLAAKFELKRQLYKSICNDPSLPNDVREEQRYKLSKLPRNSSFTRLRNRCIFTGRSRSVYQLFRVSRIVFRDLASKGLIMGVKKSSW